MFKQYFGRGPTSARTYLEPNLVIFVLTGGYTPAERTLFEAGKWYEVRQARIAWQDSMEVRFIDTFERLHPPHRQGIPQRQPPRRRPHHRALGARTRHDPGLTSRAKHRRNRIDTPAHHTPGARTDRVSA